MTSNSRFIISASLDKTIRVFCIQTGKLITQLYHRFKGKENNLNIRDIKIIGQINYPNTIIATNDWRKIISQGDNSIVCLDITRNTQPNLIHSSWMSKNSL